MTLNDSKLIGRQISYPLALNDRNQITTVSGDAAIRQSIFVILHTVPGERVMRPQFGCKIHDLIFDPANYKTAILAERYVREALETWEPRIELVDVNAEPQNTAAGVGQLMITIAYRIKGNVDLRQMVHPYYLNPESLNDGE